MTTIRIGGVWHILDLAAENFDALVAAWEAMHR